MMSEQPATLAKYLSMDLRCLTATDLNFAMFLREAKSIHQSLKELLKTKEPFDREVDFQRKKYA